jgi:preprotein translocase subunit SecB
LNIQFNASQQYDNASKIEVKVEPKVFYPENETTTFRIIMEVGLSCENCFDLKLLAVGNFEFDKDFDNEELKKSFINTNAPAIMFPYVRSFITTLTASLGNVTGALIVPTQFFQGDLPQYK